MFVTDLSTELVDSPYLDLCPDYQRDVVWNRM